jgi:hypothetical protein
MQLIGILLLLLVGLSGSRDVLGKKRALFQTIEKASAQKKLPHPCRGSLTRMGQSLEG